MKSPYEGLVLNLLSRRGGIRVAVKHGVSYGGPWQISRDRAVLANCCARSWLQFKIGHGGFCSPPRYEYPDVCGFTLTVGATWDYFPTQRITDGQTVY